MLGAPAWVDAGTGTPAHCRVDGVMAPISSDATARPINFRVVLPAAWNRRAAQLGGGGMNGIIPNLTGAAPGGPPSVLERGLATYGSDSGHQMAFGRGRGVVPPGTNLSDDWALNEEAIANLGYAQMKKTHDAAMVLIERAYGERPRFNYYIGTSQGGREALTVAQRYPADYDGIAANVPIVGFSSLMLAPELIRIHEKPLANWVTPAKINAIRGEFVRQCDELDGLADGIINNYMACRRIFDLTQGAKNRHPWTAKRCPNGIDPNPAETSAAACLTDGQISTLEFVYSRYTFATPLANGARTFGMWLPNTDPSGSGLILKDRFAGQEGAPAGGADAFAPWRDRCHRLSDEESGGQPARLHGGWGVQSSTAGAVRHSGRNQPGSLGVPEAGRQDDRDHRHQRHAGFAGRATGLLPVGRGQDGADDGGPVRAAVRHAADRARPERHQLQRGWEGARDSVRADPESLRPGRAVVRLGRARRRARHVGNPDGRREEPAALLVSCLSEIPDRFPAAAASYVCTQP